MLKGNERRELTVLSGYYVLTRCFMESFSSDIVQSILRYYGRLAKFPAKTTKKSMEIPLLRNWDTLGVLFYSIVATEVTGSNSVEALDFLFSGAFYNRGQKSLGHCTFKQDDAITLESQTLGRRFYTQALLPDFCHDCREGRGGEGRRVELGVLFP